MKTYGAKDARPNFRAILDGALAGASSLITRSGKPVAIVLPVNERAKPKGALDLSDLAAETLVKLRQWARDSGDLERNDRAQIRNAVAGEARLRGWPVDWARSSSPEYPLADCRPNAELGGTT
jgi:prevent-host-death family protein